MLRLGLISGEGDHGSDGGTSSAVGAGPVAGPTTGRLLDGRPATEIVAFRRQRADQRVDQRGHRRREQTTDAAICSGECAEEHRGRLGARRCTRCSGDDRRARDVDDAVAPPRDQRTDTRRRTGRRQRNRSTARRTITGPRCGRHCHTDDRGHHGQPRQQPDHQERRRGRGGRTRRRGSRAPGRRSWSTRSTP